MLAHSHQVASPLTTINIPNNTWVIGSEVMHPAMRQALSGKSPDVEAEVPAPHSHHHDKFSLLKTAKGAASQGFRVATDLLESWRYSRFVKNIQSQIREQLHSNDLVRFVFDANGWDSIPPDGYLMRQEGSEESESPEANAAYDNVGFVFDFFKEHLGVVLPQPLVQVVNFKHDVLFTGFENAFYTPMLMGAHLVIYGQGDGRLFGSPAEVIDIVGHEFTHFYLEAVHPDKFSYVGQSGAINEHIADVVGICVKAKAQGIESNNYSRDFWKLGAGWMLDPNVSIRDMLHPGKGFNHPDYGKDNQPAHMKKFKVTREDNGGVHYNSGIMNRLFALFTESVETPAYDVPLKIWLRAIQIVRRNPNFRDFAEALLIVAKDFDTYPQLKGHNLEAKMRAAISAVGVLDYVVVGGRIVKADALQAADSKTTA